MAIFSEILGTCCDILEKVVILFRFGSYQVPCIDHPYKRAFGSCAKFE